MSIGRKIKQAREDKNLTLDEVAKRCNTTKQTIFKYENEIVTNIPYDKILLLSKALSVSPSYFFGWDDTSSLSNQNIIRIAGRDGSYEERVLSDEQLTALKAILGQLKDATDDL